MKNKRILILFCAMSCYGKVSGQAGVLDNTFDFDGLVTTSILGSDFGYSVAIQSDGRIIVGGSGWMPVDFMLTRYNSSGSLDISFDLDGKLTTDFAGDPDFGGFIAIQNDGKIILTGSSGPFPNYSFSCIRYHSNGSLDNSFDGDGKVIVPIGTQNETKAVQIQPDGKIVLGGTSDSTFTLIRFNTDGSLDNSFDSDGILTTSVGTSSSGATSMCLQLDGKILLAGICRDGITNDLAVVRYNTNGSIDNTFDVDGIFKYDIGGYNDYCSSVKVQSDGKIILGGQSYNGVDWDMTLLRLNVDGTLDNTFDGDGIALTNLAGSNEDALSLLIQNNGKIILSGYTDSSGTSDFLIARHNTNGSPDNTFAGDGKLIIDFGATSDRLTCSALQIDGKIIVGGYISNGTGYDFALARINGDVVGVQEIDPGNSFALFPNPTNGELNLMFQNFVQNTEVNIINTSGKVISRYSNLSGISFKFDVSKISKGLYFIEINSGVTFQPMKFVKN
jgi:uncharacterized delta-60 repeat protein